MFQKLLSWLFKNPTKKIRTQTGGVVTGKQAAPRVANFLSVAKQQGPEQYAALLKYYKSLPKEHRDVYARDLVDGRLTPVQIVDKLKKSMNVGLKQKPNFKIVAGLKFSEYELNSLNSLSKKIWNNITTNKATGQLYTLKDFKVATLTKGQTAYSTQNISIRSVSIEDARKMLDRTNIPDAWANVTSNEIIIVPELMKSRSKQGFHTILTHEVAHIKDPSLISPRLQAKYDASNTNLVPWSTFNLSKDISDKGKTWFKNYYHHPFEINAIVPQVMHQITTGTKTLLKSKGVAATKSTLDLIQNWSKGIDVTWTPDALNILGYTGKLAKDEISTFFETMAKRNPDGYRKLKTDILKQTEYLKKTIGGTQKTFECKLKLKTLL